MSNGHRPVFKRFVSIAVVACLTIGLSIVRPNSVSALPITLDTSGVSFPESLGYNYSAYYDPYMKATNFYFKLCPYQLANPKLLQFRNVTLDGATQDDQGKNLSGGIVYVTPGSGCRESLMASIQGDVSKNHRFVLTGDIVPVSNFQIGLSDELLASIESLGDIEVSDFSIYSSASLKSQPQGFEVSVSIKNNTNASIWLAFSKLTVNSNQTQFSKSFSYDKSFEPCEITAIDTSSCELLFARAVDPLQLANGFSLEVSGTAELLIPGKILSQIKLPKGVRLGCYDEDEEKWNFSLTEEFCYLYGYESEGVALVNKTKKTIYLKITSAKVSGQTDATPFSGVIKLGKGEGKYIFDVPSTYELINKNGKFLGTVKKVSKPKSPVVVNKAKFPLKGLRFCKPILSYDKALKGTWVSVTVCDKTGEIYAYYEYSWGLDFRQVKLKGKLFSPQKDSTKPLEVFGASWFFPGKLPQTVKLTFSGTAKKSYGQKIIDSLDYDGNEFFFGSGNNSLRDKNSIQIATNTYIDGNNTYLIFEFGCRNPFVAPKQIRTTGVKVNNLRVTDQTITILKDGSCYGSSKRVRIGDANRAFSSSPIVLSGEISAIP